MQTPLDPAHDNVAAYAHTTWVKDNKMAFVLARKPNGECVYLAAHGCTIYARRPHICRSFDCREVVRQSNRAGRRRASPELKQVFNRGRELLHA